MIDRYDVHEIDWFMMKIDKQYATYKDLKELQSMNILITSKLATKGKKGYANYTVIRNKLLEQIRELSIDEEKLTVFEKIKKCMVNKIDNTIFSKLKYLNKDK